MTPLPPRLATLLGLLLFASVVPLAPSSGQDGQTAVPLSSLDLSKMRQGWGVPQVDLGVTERPLSIGGRRYERGVGTHADSVLHVELDGKTTRFLASVGVDDGAEGRGSVVFRVYADGNKLYDSGRMEGGQEARDVAVDLTGMRHLLLVVGFAGDDIHYDHASWAEARFEVGGAPPRAVDPPREEAVILTPPPGPEPHLRGPDRFGVRPGRPFLYRIPCTGERPVVFSVEDLPEGLTLGAQDGIVRGRAPTQPGEYAVVLHARNPHGEASKSFRIVVGDSLALTPPMGWNSWYIHYHRVTDADMRAAADAMIESGMADFGYMYVNIDDCWMKKRGDEPYRDQDGAVLCNEKFPDMEALCEYVHAKGLRAGLYTSPGPWTCAGYLGAFEHEEIDARKFAQWGFDFLKYDWCSYGEVATGEGRERLTRPYQKMADILAGLERDLVLNLCQYGMGEVWTWGGEVGGHCWRTTGDLGLAQGGRLPGFYQIGLSNARHHEHARPGQWNDPDYLLIGWVGDARRLGMGEPTSLTPNEQYSYMSMWCLMASPLIFSGDMTRLDAFTLNVLCNGEVIEVDQDPLGRQARIVEGTDELLVLAKEMADGSTAVGLFNLSELGLEITATWSQVGVEGPHIVRDLWRHQDLGTFDESFTTSVPRHGVAMLRLRAPE